MAKLSVTIITYNEERQIREALETVKWADEIVVVDSYSTDRTVEICKEYGAKVLYKEFVGFGALKNLAVDSASHDWILNLDADERITEDLRWEIEKALANPRADGYRIPRKTYFLGQWIKHCGWYPDYKSLQLFNRRKGRYTEALVHERVELKGVEGYLKGHVLQYPFQNLHHFIEKQNRYSTLMAEEMVKREVQFRIHQFVSHPLFMFLKMFVIRQGFRDGKVGLILSGLYTYYTFLKYAKLWERTGIQ